MMFTQFTLPRVEAFFADLTGDPWHEVGDVERLFFDSARSTLVVSLAPGTDGIPRTILLEIPHPSVVRVRFDPEKLSQKDYPDENSRAIVMNSMTDLRSQFPPVRVDL